MHIHVHLVLVLLTTPSVTLLRAYHPALLLRLQADRSLRLTLQEMLPTPLLLFLATLPMPHPRSPTIPRTHQRPLVPLLLALVVYQWAPFSTTTLFPADRLLPTTLVHSTKALRTQLLLAQTTALVSLPVLLSPLAPQVLLASHTTTTTRVQALLKVLLSHLELSLPPLARLSPHHPV